MLIIFAELNQFYAVVENKMISKIRKMKTINQYQNLNSIL